MLGKGAAKTIADLFFREGAKTKQPVSPLEVPVVSDPIFPTKAFPQFLSCMGERESPVILDFGPGLGSNVNYFGEQFSCKLIIEDLYSDLERFSQEGNLGEFSKFLATCLNQIDSSVDGILCWDLLDYLERPAARVLGEQVVRLLRPGGAALGFFSTLDTPTRQYTKYLVVDEVSLRHRAYPATRGRQPVLLNREIVRLFSGLNVMESFLLRVNAREVLFQKPIYA